MDPATPGDRNLSQPHGKANIWTGSEPANSSPLLSAGRWGREGFYLKLPSSPTTHSPPTH